MTVMQDEIVLAERSYYSAHECTQKMNTAFEYYSGLGQSVVIEMRDKNKRLIATLKT